MKITGVDRVVVKQPVRFRIKKHYKQPKVREIMRRKNIESIGKIPNHMVVINALENLKMINNLRINEKYRICTIRAY